jgi:hypothetical protein
MIDNHADAFPHAGLNSAVLVIEALVENGITRYMAVFAPGISPDAEAIGPVRSARVYFVQWARGLQAVYAHIGGSPASLNLAFSVPEIADMDAMYGYPGSYFYRSDSKIAPHNLYTSSALLASYIEDAGLATFDPAGLGFLFTPDSPADTRPTSQTLRYFFLFPDDIVSWDYDPTTNNYLRSWRGNRHVDELSGKQLAFKNVVVMEVVNYLIGDAEGRIEQQVIGEGKARVFANGVEREVFWRKDTGAAPLQFFAADGQEVSFTAGAIWIAAIPSLDQLTVGEDRLIDEDVAEDEEQ